MTTLKTTFIRKERIHSMDALRAIMMMLGIVLHSTEPYSLGDDSFWPKDPEATHLSLNYIFSLVHLFRMPIFFLIAGFFGALLFYERGLISMIRNRASRVVLPFIVFLLLLHPIIILVFDHTSTVFKDQISPVVTTMTLLPQITYHLWFLYYLIMITAFTLVLALWLQRLPSIGKSLTGSFEWLIRKRAVFVLLFSIVIFLMLVWMWDTWVPTRVGFIPDIKVLLFYMIFYLLGWVLFKSRHLLDLMMKGDWFFLILGVSVFTLRFIFRSSIDDVIYGALNAIIIWFFIFGIMGLFIRYASGHSLRLRYISDSSYWVYLIHLPLTAFIPALIVDWPLPAFVKFIIVMAFTTFVCFLTYHYLVRATFIGKFLNGRKYTIR